MPCSKKPLVKNWDRPKNLRVIKASRYEQNEASVKQHWKNVLKDLELSYKDEKFWDSSAEQVRGLVGPAIFKRIEKIFDLPPAPTEYVPQEDMESLVPSEEYYKCNVESKAGIRQTYSMSDFEKSEEDEEQVEEESEGWTESTESPEPESMGHLSHSKSVVLSKSQAAVSKTFSSKSKSFIKSSKTLMKSYSSRKSIRSGISIDEETATTNDDLEVHVGDAQEGKKPSAFFHHHHTRNPFFTMLYCAESETDMIKWKSKYKQKMFEVSASDEFSKKAEIMTKKIAREFYEWWTGLGNVEFKSEIRRPEDIEDLFQVWFDEHASRSLVLDPKILPCVLTSIAAFVGVPKAACPKVLNRQIAYDIHAETSPAHLMAFGTCLPQKMKHIPAKNNTEKLWHSVQIPEDLRTMACVWDDIQHLTSTKAFQEWLQQHSHLPMPPCLRPQTGGGEKKQLFVVPSDYVQRDRDSSTSNNDLALPISEFSLELKDVLSKLMNQ